MEDEEKEGRYFPNHEEQSILIGSIESYFSFPERSEQRAQIVQQITLKLQKISKRWSNRSVRLWFNNNKRTMLKQEQTVTFGNKLDPSSPFNIASRPQSIPPKKRINIPRSSSVIQTANLFNSRCSSPFQQSNIISTIMSGARDTVEEQKELESEITQHLVNCANRSFLVNVNPIDQVHQINMPSTIPDCGTAPNIHAISGMPKYFGAEAEEKSTESFPCIECGKVNVKGSPAFVVFNSDEQKHVLRYTGEKIELDLHNTANVLHYDKNLDMVFVGSGTHIKVAQEANSKPFELNTNMLPMLSPAMTSWENKVAFGSRRKVNFYDYSSIKEMNPNPTAVYESQLPSITSMASCSGMLCLASKNSHSIHVTDGSNLSTILLGHAGGVTCMSSLNDSLLLSGSADTTARVWDPREGLQVAQLQRHLGALTFIVPANDETSNVILTGGEDHYVRAWDIRMQKALFEIKCGTGNPIDATLSAENNEVSILTKQETQSTALGFIIPTQDVCLNVTNLEPNLYIKFVLKLTK